MAGGSICWHYTCLKLCDQPSLVARDVPSSLFSHSPEALKHQSSTSCKGNISRVSVKVVFRIYAMTRLDWKAGNSDETNKMMAWWRFETMWFKWVRPRLHWTETNDMVAAANQTNTSSVWPVKRRCVSRITTRNKQNCQIGWGNGNETEVQSSLCPPLLQWFYKVCLDTFATFCIYGWTDTQTLAQLGWMETFAFW